MHRKGRESDTIISLSIAEIACSAGSKGRDTRTGSIGEKGSADFLTNPHGLGWCVVGIYGFRLWLSEVGRLPRAPVGAGPENYVACSTCTSASESFAKSIQLRASSPFHTLLRAVPK